MSTNSKIKFARCLLAFTLSWGVWCLVSDANKPKPEPHRPEVTAEAAWTDNYPPVIGLLAPQVDLFDKYFGDEAYLMRAICLAENGTQDPTRVSKPNRDKSMDVGLCQINSKAHADKATIEQLKDPETNIRVAKEIRDSWESWEAWTVYRTGKYLLYIDK